MSSDEKITQELANKVWSSYLETGKPPDFLPTPWYLQKRFRDLFKYLPDNPRCRMCHSPFNGLGGSLMKHLLGFAPSRLNPQICNVCDDFIQKYRGGAEAEITILYADVRGSTNLAETMNPTDFSRLINRFYDATTKVLFKSNAMVENRIGDAVTAFYTTGLAGANHAQVAINNAREILHVTGHHQSSEPWIPVGIGIHTGRAYVGAAVSDTGAADIAVFGDTANIGARLAAQADTGEIHISQATAQAAGLDSSGVDVRRQTLKGRSEPIDVWVLS